MGNFWETDTAGIIDRGRGLFFSTKKGFLSNATLTKPVISGGNMFLLANEVWGRLFTGIYTRSFIKKLSTNLIFISTPTIQYRSIWLATGVSLTSKRPEEIHRDIYTLFYQKIRDMKQISLFREGARHFINLVHIIRTYSRNPENPENPQ